MVGLLFPAVLLLLAAALYILVPPFFGPPSVPSRPARIRRALDLAGLKPGETLFDLGAGDGRVLVIGAKEFGARAVGVEAGPVQCAVCLANALWNGVLDRVRVRPGNLFQADLSKADVVYAYLTSSQALRLRDKLAAELKPGARVVTAAFELPGWEADQLDRDFLVRLYVKQ